MCGRSPVVGSSHFTLDTPSASNHALKKVKLWDKVRSLEVLARHFGVLKDQMEQRGVIELRWRRSVRSTRASHEGASLGTPETTARTLLSQGNEIPRLNDRRVVSLPR